MRLFALTLLLASVPALAQPWAPVPALEALAPLVGDPWQSTFEVNGTEVTDVSRFEWAMRGHALRNIHANAEGTYGGETLFWAEGDSLRFLYVTSGGFTTSGTAHIRDNGALVAEEAVVGNPNGIDRVRSVSHVDADGRLHTAAEYRTNGIWSEGRSAVYTRQPDAILAPGYAPDCSSQ